HQAQHVFGRPEGAARVERDVPVADADAAAVGRDVPLLQLAVNLLFADAELCQTLPGKLEVNDLLWLGEQLDLLDVGHQEQLAAEEVGVAPQLVLCEAVTGDGEEDAVDVAEVVQDHRRAAHRRRQLGLDVCDLAAKFVPDLGDRVPVVAVLDDGGNYRPAARRLRFDALELSELLASVFDRVGDLAGDLFGTGAGVRRDDQRFLDRKLGV